MRNSILPFALGIIVGAVATYFSMKKDLDERINEVMAEVDEYKKDIEKKYKIPAEERAEKVIDEASKIIRTQNPAGSLQDFVKSRNYHDYTKDFTSSGATKDDSKLNSLKVYHSEEEFAASDFECLTYYYNTTMGLTDGDGKAVDKSFLGNLNLDELLRGEDVVYIKNELLSVDYEIYWSDEILEPTDDGEVDGK